MKHRDCQLWILLGFQLSLNNPDVLNRFEFQNNNRFQLLAQSLGCVRAAIAMLGESLSKLIVEPI